MQVSEGIGVRWLKIVPEGTANLTYSQGAGSSAPSKALCLERERDCWKAIPAAMFIISSQA